MRLKGIRVDTLVDGSVQVTPIYFGKGGKSVNMPIMATHDEDLEKAVKGALRKCGYEVD